ncbi:folate-binding protein YgfZ [Thioclava sp. IC9]|uniref:CAF17-like 4Fe-4S cluster assembly/insertion protein YgfZ n=1 Tax=Thioclava sp. IC9 TaxID=1973007 RepID=UPI000B538E45|nr:folate-binding protein YgfZ [Thioclava sp. IC9]OWY03351.1 folate-binding protein YgfZ [Thioclava sp. IC9]
MAERILYEITGTDREHFLQGLVTNDVRHVNDGLVYTALLTPQGKYLADFFLLARGDAIVIDIDESIAEATIKRLGMYKLRADVAIAPSDLKVYRGTGPAPEGALTDPRHPDMGWRLYGDEAGDDGTDWDAIRVEHCIPETGIELTPDTFILEAGFAQLNGVDFRKGCYVGQEVTARMKHKTELRKGFVTVGVEGPAEPGTEITSEDRSVGRLFTRSGDRAIAYLRFGRADGELSAGEAVVTYL